MRSAAAAGAGAAATSDERTTFTEVAPVRTKSRAGHRNVLLYAPSEADANVLYATRFFCPDPFIFIRTDKGKRIYVMSDLEIDRAHKTSNADRVLSLSHYTRAAEMRFGSQLHPADVMAVVLRDLRIRSVSVPETFPSGVTDRLRDRGIAVRVVGDPFFPERLYKTPAEAGAIRGAMRAAEKGLQAAVEVLRRSVIRNGWVVHRNRRLTAETLREVIEGTIFACGCIATHTIVAPGAQGCDPHQAGSGPIPAHQPIILDVFPRSTRTGYYADITRTVVKGKVPDRVKNMYDAVLAGQRLGLRMLRHGARTAPIHQAILDFFAGRGFETGRMGGRMQGFFHATGHGVGLDLHEPPRIAINDLVLEEGMVVTVEPGLYYHPTGGIRIEDTVMVTRRGIRNLTRFPKFLEID
jgi:Xaa-Pro aminopeptidase